ncbi:hypothetical protein MRS44_012123 [Fusarium solani]|uniref:uncharacterized protein n=1 Tax=Fusarium solani TaxID=169388 RepID=UPI0032C4A7DD|nr:hypothetical protein MRS44_012123 [Fusarium solani]
MSEHAERRWSSDQGSRKDISELACNLCKRRKTKWRPRNRSHHGQSNSRSEGHKGGSSENAPKDAMSMPQAPSDRDTVQGHVSVPPPGHEARPSITSLIDLASYPPSPISTVFDDASTDVSESSDQAAANFVRAISLSSLIHPTHESRQEPPSPSQQSAAAVSSDGFFINLVGAQRLIDQACDTLNISVDNLQTLTDLYLDNMTAFSLFHRPTFGAKIQTITSLSTLVALLASMFSVSIKFFPACSEAGGPDAGSLPSSDQFHKIATKALDDSLRETDDEAPSLSVLQAMVLCTFNELIRGVRGKGWRLLGSCVRVAYEQHLNLIDYGAPILPPRDEDGIRRWVGKEEERRCWWAIWEMDVFASTIKRCPLAIDWSVNETYLPIPDRDWFNGQYRQSSFLHPQPCERWKRLKKCDNDSPTAWFIVLNSIMRDAQALARGSLQGIRSDWRGQDETTDLQQYFKNVFCKKSPVAGDQQLYFLSQALQQTVSALPTKLAYQGERLFSHALSAQAPPNSGSSAAQATLVDVARYSLFLMTQLARFQIFHHQAFGEIASGTLFTEIAPDPPFGWTSTPRPPAGAISNCEGLRNCLEAADNIQFVLQNAPEWHVKWLNPFLASTVWLAASLQILRKVYGLGTEAETESKLALLRLTCQRYSLFWGTPLTLLRNVDSLERLLRHKRRLLAELEVRSAAKQRGARLRSAGAAPSPALADMKDGLQGRLNESLDGMDPLVPADFMPELFDPSAFIPDLEGFAPGARTQTASGSPMTTNWIGMLSERGQLDDISFDSYADLFFPLAPPQEVDQSPRAGSLAVPRG